ncbi:MAG: FapA family protein [Bradymonadia bacterium]
MIVICAACKATLRIPADSRAKRVRCPKCRQTTPLSTAAQARAGPAPPPTSSETSTQTAEFADSERCSDVFQNTTDQDLHLGYILCVDRISLEVSLEVSSLPNVIQTPAQLESELMAEQIRHGIDQEAIRVAFLCLEYPEDLRPRQRFTIAQGVRPQRGCDGHVEYLFDATGAEDNAKPETDDEAIIDYKAMTSIPTVSKGDHLAILTEPRRGRAGVDLGGQAVPGIFGHPIDLVAGDGVEFDETQAIFFATKDGRPTLSENTLCVLDVYEIEADIDMSVGSIEFNGHVLVHGNVLDEFSIKCKSIMVHGTVGAAFIQCSGDAHFLGGVHGNERGRIRVEGTTVAKYLNEAELHSHGDIVIEGGISNSKIHCLGRLHVDRIIGGYVSALGGIQTNYLGSDLGISTLIRIGEHPARRNIAGRIDRKMTLLANDFPRKTTRPIDIDDDRNEHDEFANATIAEESDMSAELQKQWIELANLQKELARITSMESNEGVPQMNIEHHIYGDVTIGHKDSTLEITHPHSGKRSVGLTSECCLELTPHKPLRPRES